MKRVTTREGWPEKSKNTKIAHIEFEDSDVMLARPMAVLMNGQRKEYRREWFWTYSAVALAMGAWIEMQEGETVEQARERVRQLGYATATTPDGSTFVAWPLP